jgi:ATP-dependent DNA helicase RecQ
VNDSDVLLSHLEHLASKHFGLQGLRPLQKKVFVALQSQRQVLAMLPTGAGKTLLYALGSLLFNDSVTIVICPLIALMRDQHQRMREAGIDSVVICSEQDPEERREAYRQLLQGRVRLLFISPERFCLSGFQKFIRRLKIGMIVVDEVHCVVTWGHSFRPEYSQLSGILGTLRVSRLLALTATASVRSRDLIKEMVFPDPTEVFEIVEKPLNKNIKVESVRVFSEDERWRSVVHLLKESVSKKSILYFTRREQCQTAAQELRKLGYNSIIYHAGLHSETRKSVETYLRQSERKVVICATLAFGMGIDLPDIQLIVLVGFPANLEEMFQMMGRAGRKGEESRAVIVWSGSDPKKRSFQFDKTMPEIRSVRERLQYLTPFFPGSGQTQPVRREDMARALAGLFKSERDLDSALANLTSTIAMLGCGGGLESVRSDWIFVKVPRPEVLTTILSELPAGPSRRRLVLEWMRLRTNSAELPLQDLKVCFSLLEISDELRISSAGIMEVFRFYEEQGKLQFQQILLVDSPKYFLISGSVNELYKALPKYQRWRAVLQEGLQALSAFVTEDHCRMAPAEDMFLSRSGASVRSDYFCGRCDLCFSKGRGVSQSEVRKMANSLTLESTEGLR